jgi:hypothetical protein
VDFGAIFVTRADPVQSAVPGGTLAEAVRLFRAGRVEAAAELFDALDRAALSPADRTVLDTLFLATRALGLGDTDAFLARLPDIPDALRPDLRYRALLNHDRTRAAAAFRRRMAAAAAPELRTDWAWSLALRALHRGHRRAGFALYRHRFGAINRVQGAPAGRLDYVPLSARACDTVFLEQGLGDSIYHLTLIKGLRDGAPLRIAASPRFLPLIRRALPGWPAATPDEIAAAGPVPANGSGDFMGLAWARQGHGRPVARLLDPVRHRPARFGISWRGGSHQNRVEERRIPLDRLLALLPPDRRFLVLQHDMTAEERAILAGDRRVDLPCFDPVADLESLAEAVAGLAGMIGVDGSAIHIAGCCGVPVLALMNARPHWYWGPDRQVSVQYPDAVTVPIGAPDPEALAEWCAARAADHALRPRPRPPIGGPAFRRPVLVTGAPRSGASLAMAMLAQAGLWTGRVVPPGAPGAFENLRLRDGLSKPILERFMAADPAGIQSLPAFDAGFAAPHLARLVARAIRDDGYDGATPWGIKDPRLALMWPQWAEAFPDAHWVVVTREREATVRSCLRTAELRRHSTDPAFWRLLHDAWQGRLAALEAASRGRVHRVGLEQLATGAAGPLRALAAGLGLGWSEDAAGSLPR